MQIELTHFRLQILTHFSLELSGKFGIEQSQTKNEQHSQIIFKLYQLFINDFLCQIVAKSSFYLLLKLITTWLTQLCNITKPKLFVFDLASTTNPNLQLNLNYKKLLKYVNTINFVFTNLNYKKSKNVSIPLSYFLQSITF